MKTEATIINVILDAAKGSTKDSSFEAISGTPIGKLPTPVRAGYTFGGWYHNGALVTEETVIESTEDITLVARWSKKAGGNKDKSKKMSSLRRQKLAIAILAAVSAVMIGVLVFVNYIITIYPMVDVYYDASGALVEEKYYLRKKDGVYGMYRDDGTLLPTNQEGYYIADGSGNQYKVDPETGECTLYARVDYDPEKGELLGYSDRVMLFPQILQDHVYSIEVKNSYDSFSFIRNDEGKIVLKVDGYDKEVSEYDGEIYAYLCVSCGYTLSTQRLDLSGDQIPRLADGSVDYSAYGLRDVYNEAGELIYSPTTYTITKVPTAINEKGKEVATSYTPSDIRYSVVVGDRTPTGKGYYAQFPGRDTIYVLDASLENSLLLDAEELVTPKVSYPLTMSTSYLVYDFELMRFQDWLAEDLDAPGNWEAVVGFSYAELSARENTLYHRIPYLTDLELMRGYTIEDEMVSKALYHFVEMESMGCRALGVTEENLKKYNLDKNVHYISFSSVKADEGNDTDTLIKSVMIVSQKTPQGTYYVASYLYDMIVEVDQYYFDFLEREDKDWYKQYFIMQDISYVDYMKMELNGEEIEFTIDNTLSYAYYYQDGVPTLVKRSNGSINLRTDGSYWFIPRGESNAYQVHLIDFNQLERFSLNSKDQVVYKINDQELIIEPDASNLLLYSPQYTGGTGKDPNRLNYNLTHTYINSKGDEVIEHISAEDNFRKFWIQDWYWLSLEGDVDKDEFLQLTGKTVAEYIASEDYYASITVHVKDNATVMNHYYEDGEKLYVEDNERYLIYRFYRYSDYKAMVTVEEVTEFDENGNPISDPTNVVGRFYVLTTHLETMFEDLGKVIDGERVARD